MGANSRSGSSMPLLNPIRQLAFIFAYMALDWASYLHPLHGLNITLWNPAPALGLVLWMAFGRTMAIPWFVAIMAGDFFIRGMPASLPMTCVLSVFLTLGYGAIGECLRRKFSDGQVFDDRIGLVTWLGLVGGGALANSLVYIGLLSLADLLPESERLEGLSRFWVGDCVGILVCMPILWMLLTRAGRAKLGGALNTWETAGYAGLAFVMLWVTFGAGPTAEFQYFYFLFPPVIWAAARQGLPGAAASAFLMQAGIILAVEHLNLVAVTVLEFQMLATVLALVGFFIGVVVDEQGLAAEKLRQSLNLAAAGEMAAALAHELNQPMTALAAYGNACQYLLEHGESGPPLRDAIQRMVSESTRAAEVLRRVRDFFRTGATRLELIEIGSIIAAAASRFAEAASRDGIILEVAPGPDIVRVDRLQIEVVLRNLLANAFDALASHPGGERRIGVSVEPGAGHCLIVTVRDSGDGLSASAIGKLFEPFFSTKSSGLGLGLVISRALIEAHGGQLWAEAGKNGIFRFSLPARDDGKNDAET